MKYVYTLVIALSISASVTSTSDKTLKVSFENTNSLNVSGTVDMVASGTINVEGTVDVSPYISQNFAISFFGLSNALVGLAVAKDAVMRMFRADPPYQSLNSSEGYLSSPRKGAGKQLLVGVLWATGGLCLAISPHSG